MSQEVTVHVNRGVADSLEADVEGVETRESFALVLESHGSPAHVHCRLDGDLERIGRIEEANYYVAADGETIVPVDVAAGNLDEPVRGTLEVSVGYGSESLAIPVTVAPAPASVDVDESLAEPAPPEPESTDLERLLGTVGLEPGTVAVVALALVAVGVGTVTAATINGLVGTVGTAIVMAGVVVAIGLLLR